MKSVVLAALLLVLLCQAAWAQDTEAQVATAEEELAEMYLPTVGAMEFTEIPAVDPDASAEFYSSLFGWNIERSTEEGTEGMVFFTDPGFHMGAFFAAEAPVDCSGVVFYITVEDVTAKLEEIVAAGGMVLLERTALPGDWGFIANFADPSGNVVGLWSAQ